MIAELRLTPEASNELEAAALWYERQHAGLGHDFLRAVDHALDLVRQFPRSGSPFRLGTDDIDVRRAPVTTFPYHVVYVVQGEAIHVLAVAHAQRRPGYWRKGPTPGSQ